MALSHQLKVIEDVDAERPTLRTGTWVPITLDMDALASFRSYVAVKPQASRPLCGEVILE